MDTEDDAHEIQQGIVPLHSSSVVNRSSGASVPAASQAEASENGYNSRSIPLPIHPTGTSGVDGQLLGSFQNVPLPQFRFYVPFSVPPSNTPSPGIPFSIPFPESHTFPGGSPVMSHDNSRSNPPGFTEYPPLTTGIHAWNSQLHPDGAPLSSALRPRSQTNLSFFPSGALAAQSHLATHGPEPQTTPGNSDQSTSLARRTLPSTFPVHPLPAQFASGPLHTPYNSFPGQYVMSTHTSLFQNQPYQPHMYHGYHPLGPSPYPPTRFFPLPRHQPQPYFQHQFSMEGGNPSYQQARHLPPTMPQFASSSRGPSHARSYDGAQQYPPHLYNATGHFGLPQQYQPSVCQWYYSPGSSADTGDPMQVQRHYPVNYSHPRTQRPRRDSNTLRAQSTGSECLPSPSLGPSSSSIAVTVSRNTISPAAGDPPEQISVQSSPKTGTHQLTANTSRAHDGPPIRRHYHPNPPPHRSEWVMWVGNVPSEATHDELWRFLKQSAPVSSDSEGSGGVEDSGILSIFLISRSNCAFANYQSEEHLNRAISQFSGRKLRPHDRRCPRLVCRARRKEDDLRAGVGAQRGMGVHTHYVQNVLQKGSESLTVGEETTSSKSRQSDPSKMSDPPPAPSASRDEETPKSDTVEGANHKVPTRSPSSYASTSSSFLDRHFPKRFFILKSLTCYDLDLSIERGVWATQKHNEVILDQAFRTSSEVILIFSVNKSGEFYGYARMASGISRGNRSVSWAPRADSPPSTPSPSISRVPTHGTPEQCESSSRQSPEMYTSPSERRFVEVSPSPLAPSSDETKDSPSATSSSQVGSAQERRSAPPALDRDSEDLVSPDPPLPGFSASPPSDPHLPSILRPEYPGVRAGTRSKDGGGMDDPGNLAWRLLPVVEELHTGSGVEEDQPAQMATLSAAMHSHSEGQEREASWGETFKIEWLCTERVQFHRTRHLRNPWNHDREIKVSRDGTELEPTVGQQLVDSWSTLASEPAGRDDVRRTACLGRRGAKSVPKPGPSAESKGVKEEPS